MNDEQRERITRLVESDMYDAARELLGAGFVPDYYASAASDFVSVALYYLDAQEKRITPNLGPKDIKIYHSEGEWSAIYVKGVLEKYGDTYLIWEKLIQVLGIAEETSEDWFDPTIRGQAGIARTTAEVEVKKENRLSRESTAETLERQAAALEEQARIIREGIKRDAV